MALEAQCRCTYLSSHGGWVAASYRLSKGTSGFPGVHAGGRSVLGSGGEKRRVGRSLVGSMQGPFCLRDAAPCPNHPTPTSGALQCLHHAFCPLPVVSVALLLPCQASWIHGYWDTTQSCRERRKKNGLCLSVHYPDFCTAVEHNLVHLSNHAVQIITPPGLVVRYRGIEARDISGTKNAPSICCLY